jgi:hypothetical protein
MRALEEGAVEVRVEFERGVDELRGVVPAVDLDERERAVRERHRPVGLVEFRDAREGVGRQRELPVVEERDAVVVPAPPVGHRALRGSLRGVLADAHRVLGRRHRDDGEV